MHAFSYVSPNSVEELLSLYSNNAGSARILAGGTDLIVQMRTGARTPGLVIDAKRVPEFNSIAINENGLTIGAAVNCRAIYMHEDVASRYPALADATSLIGGIQIQGRASIGGNLCNASPSADTIPALMVLGAKAHIRGANSNRMIAVEDFCTGPGNNILAEDEVLVNIGLPIEQANSGSAFLRFTPRNEMDIAVANAAASVVLSEGGDHFLAVQIAFGAAGPTPILATEASESLEGRCVSGESIESAAKLAREIARPIDDMRGGADQRRHLVQVLVTRALSRAVDRAGGVIS